MKNFTKACLIVAIAVAFCCPCFARIGENPDQLRARYGDPLHATEKLLVFLKNDIYVTAEIFNGSCHKIAFGGSVPAPLQVSQFVFEDDPPDARPEVKYVKKPDLNKDQIDFLLQANAGSKPWVIDPTEGRHVAPDRLASISKGGLEIVTIEFANHLVSESKKTSETRTEGF